MASTLAVRYLRLGGRMFSFFNVATWRSYSWSVSLPSLHAENGHGFSAAPCATTA